MNLPLECRLAGQKAVISVGSPWNFESTAGQNRLEGQIVSVENAKEDSGVKQSVTLEVTPFVAETGKPIARLKAGARYVEDQDNFVKQIAEGHKVPANLSYADQVTKEQMPEGSLPFLIGSVCLSPAADIRTGPSRMSLQ